MNSPLLIRRAYRISTIVSIPERLSQVKSMNSLNGFIADYRVQLAQLAYFTSHTIKSHLLVCLLAIVFYATLTNPVLILCFVESNPILEENK